MTRHIGTIRNKRTLCEKTGDWINVTLYFLDGVEVTKKEFDKVFPDKDAELSLAEKRRLAASGCARWPMKSVAMAVHPDQVKEANAFLEKHGSKCHHTKDGRMVIPDNAERKKVLKLKGYFDKDSFN